MPGWTVRNAMPISCTQSSPRAISSSGKRNADFVCAYNSSRLVVDHMDTIELCVFKLAVNGLAKAGGGGYDEYVRWHLVKSVSLIGVSKDTLELFWALFQTNLQEILF
jgi:hypothetical protein